MSKNPFTNRKNRYSIRKFTVGTASIIIGATLLFGAGQDAKAAEEDGYSQEVGKDTSDSSDDQADVQTKQTEPSNNDTQADENSSNNAEEITTDSSEQEQSSQNGTEHETEATTEQTSEENSSDTANNEEKTKVEDQQSEPETKTNEQTQSEEKDADVETPQSGKEQIEPTTKKSTVREENETTSDEKVQKENVAEEDVVSGKQEQSEGSTTTAPTESKRSVIINKDNLDENQKAELDAFDAEYKAAEDKSEVLTNVLKDNNFNDEQSAEILSNIKDGDLDNLSSDEVLEKLIYEAIQYSQKHKLPETYATVPTSTTNSISETAGNGGTSFRAVEETGRNVNDKVNFTNLKTDIKTKAGGTRNEFWVTSGDYLLISGDYTVDNDVHSGDYFTFDWGNYFRQGGIHTPPKPHFLYSDDGRIVARGTYDTSTNTTKYVFTDYVDSGLQNIHGHYETTGFTNKDSHTNDKQAYPTNFRLGGESFSSNIVVDYGHPKDAILTTGTNYVDSRDNTYHMTNYINQSGVKKAGYGLKISLKNMKFDNASNIKLYRVTNNSSFTDNYNPDVSNLQLVNTTPTISADGTVARFDYPAFNMAGGQKYIVQYTAKPTNDDPSSRELRTDLYELGNEGNSYNHTVYISTFGSVSSASGENKPTPKLTYELGDYVWEDSNKDGIQNSNERGIQGVTVVLKNSNGQEIKRTTTDSNGKYLFTGLENGNYTVEFGTPDGYEPTVVDAGTNDEVDSDGSTVNVTINGGSNYTIDSGFHKKEVEPPKEEAKYEIGDYVWEDSNKDGVQNSNEHGIQGVTVILKNNNGQEIKRTTTDSEGKYLFSELSNGTYTVEFETPNGYVPTKTNVGDDHLDSDGQSVCVTVNNANDYTIDSGFHKPDEQEPPKVEAKYEIGDYVWEDSNKDGIQNSNERGIQGVTVILKNSNGQEIKRTTTDSNGKYLFSELSNGKYTVEFETPEGYEPTKANVGDDRLDSDGQTVDVTVNNANDYTIDSGFHKPDEQEPPKVEAKYEIGDYVWEDSNKDGIQNSNEHGIQGVTVILKGENGQEIKRTTTDANGKYLFSELSNGTYTVEFETPEGYEPTKENVGNDHLDSDGQSVRVTVNNANDYTIDSGFHKPDEQEPPKEEAKYEIGDYVWEDSNKDGIQNSNERGIQGVTVILKGEDGNEIKRTTTDTDGKYLFTDLSNGKYTVEFETPEGYEPTKANAGSDDRLDSDGQRVEVTVNNANDYTIDSGFHKPEETPEKPESTYEIGDYVWEDSNEDGIQNKNEKGIEGVTVILKDKDGKEINRTTTDKDGGYKFTGLHNGDYTVEFETPEGYEPTKPNEGDNPELDSNGTSVHVTVNNRNDHSIDSGFHKKVETPEKP
ncbi:carboxypeptidase regulatory-like domain-containing protein [Staphylococcus pettenkoferi]|nr:SdrD B-like domain-containing protein [Staphylococcus pettenkoferi]MCY1567244.1 carboxypeptidase regulatory-like domain-containing protein [Staphylococcus pettenkoferi]MCY1588412.1 carboxypeptidase regulatory-like domain-containing protein [Staphylococcus pettenkoferi]